MRMLKYPYSLMDKIVVYEAKDSSSNLDKGVNLILSVGSKVVKRGGL